MSPLGSADNEMADRCHLYVDEAGTPDIFDAKGRIHIGQPGCSSMTALGKEAFLWDQFSGMRKLSDVLTAQGIMLPS